MSAHLLLGIVILGFGLYTTIQRLRGNETAFKKLEPLREMFGSSIGNFIHIIAYCILPIVAGIVLILSGTN